MVFPRRCSLLKHPFSSGFQDWPGIIWRKGPWNLSFGSILLFGTKSLLLCLLCFSFSNPLVEFPWIPTSWPVPVSLCGRVSERDPVCWLQNGAPNDFSSSGLSAGWSEDQLSLPFANLVVEIFWGHYCWKVTQARWLWLLGSKTCCIHS